MEYPRPRTLVIEPGVSFGAGVKPELESNGEIPWCVRVHDAWYMVDNWKQIDADRAPQQAFSFGKWVAAFPPDERGPAWLATRETPLLLEVEGHVLRAYVSQHRIPGPRNISEEHWTFEIGWRGDGWWPR